MNRCFTCPFSRECEHYLPFARCAYIDRPIRSLLSRRRLHRAHVLNMVGCAVVTAGLLISLGIKVA